MKEKIKQLLNNPLIKKTITALTGTSLAQVVTILSIPILSRLLSPEVTGIYSTFIAYSTIVYVLLTGSFDQAVSVAKSMKECMAIFKYIVIKGVAYTAVLITVCAVFKEPLASLMKIQKDTYILYLIPVYSALFALYMACYYFYLRWGEVKLNARLKVVMAVGVVIFNISFALFYKGESSMIVSQTAAYALVMLLQIKPVKKCLSRAKSEENVSMTAVLKEYKSYPAKVLPGTLINNVALQLPSIMLLSLFNPAAAGYYSMVNKALNLPSTAISAAFSDVFRNEAVECAQSGNPVRPVFIKFLKILSVICIPIYSCIIIFSPWAFGFILGAQWKEAGYMAAIMGFMYLFKSLSLPFSFNLVLYNKYNQNLLLQFILMCVSFLSFFVGSKISTSWMAAIIPYTVGFVGLYSVYLLYSNKLSKNKVKG